MSFALSSNPGSPYDRHRGPHPGIVAVVYVCLFIGSLVCYGILSHGTGFPNPLSSLEKAQQAFLQYPDAFRMNALMQFGAAIPLAIFTAAVTSRLSFLGVNVTGVSIALFGGISASLLVTISSLCCWILSQPGVADDRNIMHVVQLFAFGSGGVGHVVALGLLMAGVCVPCLFGHYTPKWLAWLGLVLAGIAELSTLSMVVQQLTVLLPVVRFSSYIWMIGTGFTLTKNRSEAAASK